MFISLSFEFLGKRIERVLAGFSHKTTACHSGPGRNLRASVEMEAPNRSGGLPHNVT
ncbi:MAG TPA: hypothetical protein VMU69_15640 [Bradyrhizobium sp.]|nr:hypothetical protein [Bradyrhizobium sp.]